MTQLKEWAIIENEKCTIVIPTRDIKAHIAESYMCPCKPGFMIWNALFGLMDRPLIVHNSFKDGKLIAQNLDELFKEIT